MKTIEDYIKDGELDEEKLIEDLTAILVPMDLKEEGIQKILDKTEDEKKFGLFIEYFTKRKELADEYVKKLKESK